MTSDAFTKSLRKRGLYSDFKKDLNKRQQQCRIEREKELDEIRKRKRDGIEKDRRHRRVLNLCIFPFYNTTSPPSQMGYHFVRASPLGELGVKNVDFLIYNFSRKRHLAIFGEAKGSIDSPSKVVTQTRERIGIIEDNQDYIKSTYLQLKEDTEVDFEFVIGIPVEDNLRVCEAIEKDGGGLIPWSAGGLEENLLSLNIPEKIEKNIRKTMKHLDSSLNDSLKGMKSHDNCFSLFPESHQVTKLEVIVETSSDLIVETAELKKKLYSYLFYLKQDRIDAMLQEILSKARELGIIKRIDAQNYKLKSVWKKKEKIARDLRSKWVEHSVKKEISGDLERIEAEVIQEFKEKIERQKTLEAY